MPKSVKATIFIPTYNGEKYLDDILKMLFRQQVDFTYEVLIIDSGSTDSTLDIIRKYQSLHENLHLEQIPSNEFGHGKTRNLGAKLAKGEYIVYLSHDAVPAHKEWLKEMLAPFELNKKVMAVFGKQDPRKNCFPLMKYDIQKVFSQIGPAYAGLALYYDGDFIKDKATRDFASFYSDVNSATKRDFLLNEIPYRDVQYSEDQLFGEDIIRAGYIKAYTPRGNVWHSNDVTLQEYKMRMFDETIGLRKTGHNIKAPSILGTSLIVFRSVVGDSLRILQDSSYGRKRKLYWLFVNPLYHIQKWRGVRRAALVDLHDDQTHEKYSLEANSKKD